MSNERIDYEHYAGKYACATGNDGSTWSKADLKVLLDEISRMYEREDEMTFRLMQVLKERKDLRDQLLNVLDVVSNASK